MLGTRIILPAMSCLLSLVFAMACDDRPMVQPQRQPVAEQSLKALVKNEFIFWGQGPDGMYAVGHTPGVFFVWRWHESTIAPHLAIPPKSARKHAWIGQGEYICKQGGVIELRTPGSPDVVREWQIPWGWYFGWIGQSPNGKYIALLLEEDSSVRPEGFDRRIHRVRIGVLGPDRTNLDWDCVIGESPDAMNIRSVIPSDDERFVAIGGWNGGVAVVDTNTKQLLWSKRPAEEVVSYYVAFSKDGDTVYLAGVCGYVFGFDTKNGQRKIRWCPTASGRNRCGKEVRSLCVSSDGRYLAAGAGQLVFILDTRTGEVVDVVNHGAGTYLASFSPDADSLATLSSDAIRVWKIVKRENDE